MAVFHPAGATLGRLHPAPWAGFTSSTCRLPRPLAREREGARRYHIKLQPLGRGFGGWAKLQDGRLLNPLYSTRLLGYLGKQWWPNLGLFVHAHALRQHPQTNACAVVEVPIREMKCALPKRAGLVAFALAYGGNAQFALPDARCAGYALDRLMAFMHNRMVPARSRPAAAARRNGAGSSTQPATASRDGGNEGLDFGEMDTELLAAMLLSGAADDGDDLTDQSEGHWDRSGGLRDARMHLPCLKID